jgi:hypothetical protein
MQSVQSLICIAAICSVANAFVQVPLRTPHAPTKLRMVLEKPPVYTEEQVSRPISGGLIGKGVYRPADWLASFESQINEHDFEVTEIEGKLPADLEGTFFR